MIKIIYKFFNIIIFILFICFFLTACNSSNPKNNEGITFIDKDRDGFPVEIDCNDNNMLIYPDAPELAMDGYDNNCNDQIDEEITINFDDIILKKIIIETLQLDNEEVTNYDILHLDFLYARNSSIVSLKGLEYATRLRNLDLANNQISDIVPIVKNKGIKGKDVFVDLVNNLLDEEDCLGINDLIAREIEIYHDVICKSEVDKDNDNFYSNADCNDNDPLIYPGASEIVNDKIDNNCNHLVDENENIKFKDINLKNAVLNSINSPKDEVSNYEMLKLSSLNVSNMSIVDLKGLEYAIRLRFLDLSGNQIRDISPIVNNNGFEGEIAFLDITDNQLDEEDCENIKTLIERNVQVKYDVFCSILVDLDKDGHYSDTDCDDDDPFTYPGAIELGNDLKDNNCNKKIDELEIIEFNDINFKNSVLDALNSSRQYVNNREILKLNFLFAGERSIVDLKGLEYATNIKNLDLSGNRVTDISSIVNNIGIKDKGSFVNLINNSLDDEDCINLEKLINRGVQVYHDVSCSFVVDMDRDGFLSNIDCNDNDPLIYPGAPELSNDHIDNNCNRKIDEAEIVDFNDRNFKEAIALSLNSGKDADSVIYNHDLKELPFITFVSEEISDIKGLEYAYRITSIEISNGRMDSIKEMAWLKNLKYCKIKSPNLKDISPIKNLVKLNKLFLSNNSISDISPLQGLTNLIKLSLDGNQISDITPLIQNNGIYGPKDSVNLYNNPLDVDDCENIMILIDREVNVLHGVRCE